MISQIYLSTQNKEVPRRESRGTSTRVSSWNWDVLNPSPSHRTLHWLFKHNAHRDLDPTVPGLAAIPRCAQDDAHGLGRDEEMSALTSS